ncbi:hypothetical protein [Microbacterium oxydans]|uniref:hypothetical protein n=1 Tax=Microbacterium oxydans TaxID=82380 RepID=UPI000A62E580|nr:hypothetical protein [Microbacterium oxydans]
MKRAFSILGVGALAIAGALLGTVASPSQAEAGVADTVCCYRWWGVGTEVVVHNLTKTSPKVAEVDWARVYLAGESLSYGVVIRIASNTTGPGGHTSTGPGNAWVTVDPPGTVTGSPYGLCYWTDWQYAGYKLQLACEMKLRR